ncbi:methyltransferase, TIGR04290 family protein [Geomonas limicola]|uniref:Methyltransferase, TIGR04290 family protein n=1 Tax=Geomonas limicola TaxID=2740186 RepID=A0A6V8N205_9BACT|nr:TIGR04290 family methyltransferase [Geomonas limicola]GFO66528.1 methyltransferase, TIGR04290 family protein [Geomonas limicola]
MTDYLDPTIAALGPWFHNLHLPDGRQTAPDHYLGDFPNFKWQEIAGHIPADLSGWRALDVGCNAGFYSFELAKRGARVLGIDLDPRYLDQARWAAGEFGLSSRVEFRCQQVYDLVREEEEFDLVLFMGVLYHLRYPLLGLDIVTQRVQRLLVFQTLTLPGREVADQPDHWINERDALLQTGWPKAAFIEHRFAGDPTNWWILNHACVEALLRSCGMKITAYPGHEVYLCEPDPGRPSCMTTWNRGEFLSATGQPWQQTT